jgi:hypothetical protein
LKNYAADKLIKVTKDGQMKITSSELEALVLGEFIGDKNADDAKLGKGAYIG